MKILAVLLLIPLASGILNALQISNFSFGAIRNFSIFQGVSFIIRNVVQNHLFRIMTIIGIKCGMDRSGAHIDQHLMEL